jgi:hypothetical protein
VILEERFAEASLRFLKLEVELSLTFCDVAQTRRKTATAEQAIANVEPGLTFCDVAQTRRKAATAEQAIANAETAYATLLQYLDSKHVKHIDEADLSALRKAAAQLRSRLDDIKHIPSKDPA